jgi:membrane-associated phospholipid phosphatase
VILINSQDNQHFPSDVIAGGILGAVTGSLFFYTSYDDKNEVDERASGALEV